MNQQPYQWTLKRKIIAGVVLLIVAPIAIGIAVGDANPPTTSTYTPPVTAKVEEVKDAKTKVTAQKELDEVLTLSKNAGVVTSYEFSESANVVFVGSGWYTQTVEFKKDFLAKISNLKERATGYHRFEVRDAYSNEKVAEVTAFSGSLEVYK
jgi:hypothetical protein